MPLLHAATEYLGPHVAHDAVSGPDALCGEQEDRLNEFSVTVSYWFIFAKFKFFTLSISTLPLFHPSLFAIKFDPFRPLFCLILGAGAGRVPVLGDGAAGAALRAGAARGLRARLDAASRADRRVPQLLPLPPPQELPLQRQARRAARLVRRVLRHGLR
eukprot:2324021-Rhodomonas_salina.2